MFQTSTNFQVIFIEVCTRLEESVESDVFASVGDILTKNQPINQPEKNENILGQNSKIY